jgi:hypothetical protein
LTYCAKKPKAVLRKDFSPTGDGRQTELKHKVKMKEKYFGMNVKMNCHAFKNGSK